jgi:glycerol-3-phosphate dehydrogenase
VPVAQIPDTAAFQESLASQYADSALPETLSHLIASYGTDARKILKIAEEMPELAEIIDNRRDNICAEAVFCAQEEMVLHLDDLIFRRTGIGTIGNPGLPAIIRCATLLAEKLQWSQSNMKSEIETTMAQFPDFDTAEEAT